MKFAAQFLLLFAAVNLFAANDPFAEGVRTTDPLTAEEQQKTFKLPPGFTVRSLRHSAATLMLALGVQPKVVQETLGHSRIAVTMDVYSHVLPHLQDEAAAKMHGLLAAN